MTTDAGSARVDKLRLARAADSTTKQQRALAAVEHLHAQGDRVTFARVARVSAVSTWFTYNNTHVALAIRRAQADQAENGLHITPRPAERVSAASLRVDLEHARDELRESKQENGQLRRTLSLRLGAELENTNPAELLDRLHEAERHSADLASRLTAATDHNHDLSDQLAATRDDLQAARESLRRAIRAVPSR